jgi:hypothetical protein
MQSTVGIYVSDRHVYLAQSGDTTGELRVKSCPCGIDPVTLPREPQDLAGIAQSIGEALLRDFPQGVTARMALPAHWCLIHTVPVEWGDVSGDSAAYAFEEHIPVELERLTWTATKPNDGHVLVAAVFTPPILNLLKRLEEFRVSVERVTIDAVLLLNDKASHKGDGAGFVLLDSAHATIAGRSRSSEAGAFVRSLRHDGNDRCLSHHLSLAEASAGLDRWQAMHLEGRARIVESDDILPATSAVDAPTGDEAARRILTALLRGDGALDLRRGPLAFAGRWWAVQRRLRRCAAAALLLFVLLGLRWRLENVAYQRSLEETRSIQNQAYQRVFPGAPAQAGAALRLRSERIKLEGLTKSTAASDMPSRSGMEVFRLLHAMTASVPPSVKLNVHEIDVDEGRVRVIGHTTNHTAAGEWVQELNKIGAVQADPPRTTLRKDGTVEFRIHAQKAEEHGQD